MPWGRKVIQPVFSSIADDHNTIFDDLYIKLLTDDQTVVLGLYLPDKNMTTVCSLPRNLTIYTLWGTMWILPGWYENPDKLKLEKLTST